MAFIGSAIVLVLAGHLYLSTATGMAPPYVSPWKLDQYGLSYQDLGLARRALPGSVLTLFAGDAAAEAILPTMLATAAVLGAVLALLCWRLADPFLTFAVLVSPATFLQIGFELGRFDQLNLILLLTIVFVRSRHAILLAPVMVLIHEGSVVQFLPLAFYCNWVVHGANRLLLVSAGLAVAVLLLLLAGTEHDPAVLRALYPHANPESIAVLTRTLGENIAFVAAQFSATEAILYVGLVAALFLHGLMLVIVRGYAGHLPRAGIGLLAASAPLALGIVGIDMARWIALAVFNLFVLALFARKHGAPTPPLASSVPLHLLLVVYALPGPLGIVFAYEGALQAWWPFV